MGVEHGGQGYGLAELAVVLEELGRWCTPGPLLPTVIAAVAVDRWAGDPRVRTVAPAHGLTLVGVRYPDDPAEYGSRATQTRNLRAAR